MGCGRSAVTPVVGITSYVEEATWGHWTAPAVLVPLSYARSVELAGGRPVVLPPVAAAIDETLAALDGLVLSGGADLDPARYGAEAHPGTSSLRVDRDRAELALLAAALEDDIPVLGVCRGMQLLNVVCGGDLHQHLPDVVGHDGHRERRGTFSEHDVTLAANSRTSAIVGRRARVLSTHHQAPGRVGAGLHAVGWAEDGTIEAIEDPRRPFAVGVLWHPEEEEAKPLFQALVDAARRRRDERPGGQVPRLSA